MHIRRNSKWSCRFLITETFSLCGEIFLVNTDLPAKETPSPSPPKKGVEKGQDKGVAEVFPDKLTVLDSTQILINFHHR